MGPTSYYQLISTTNCITELLLITKSELSDHFTVATGYS